MEDNLGMWLDVLCILMSRFHLSLENALSMPMLQAFALRSWALKSDGLVLDGPGYVAQEEAQCCE